jgi:hypothetical protein
MPICKHGAPGKTKSIRNWMSIKRNSLRLRASMLCSSLMHMCPSFIDELELTDANGELPDHNTFFPVKANEGRVFSLE